MEDQAAALLDDLRSPEDDQGFCDQAETVLDNLRAHRDTGEPLAPLAHQYLDRALQQTPISELTGYLQQVVGGYARANPTAFCEAVLQRFSDELITFEQAAQLLGVLEPALSIQAMDLLERQRVEGRRLSRLALGQRERTITHVLQPLAVASDADRAQNESQQPVTVVEKEEEEEEPLRTAFDIMLDPKPRIVLRRGKKANQKTRKGDPE